MVSGRDLRGEAAVDPASVRGSGMGGGVVPGLFDPPEAMRPTLLGSRGAVVGGHPITTQVALDVLAAGGTAIDAGVAAAIASNVVQPDMANFGGIAPILVRTAGCDEVMSVGGVGVWGREASIDGFLARHGARMPLGPPVAITPGAPGAYLETLARFGTWTFRDVAAPAIALATDGFPVDQRLAHTLNLMVGGLRWETTKRVYQPHGRALTVGDRLVQADLGRLLATLADAERGHADRVAGIAQVRRCFFTGDIAERLAAEVTAGGGWMTTEDLAAGVAEVAVAPARTVDGWRVATTSTWTQGPIVLQALGILEGLDLGAPGSARWLHAVVEALKLAFSERERAYGDPAVPGPDGRLVDVAALLADEHLAGLRGRIGDRALPNLPTMPSPRSTTYLCVIDGEGNAFSCAPSDTIDGAPLIDGLGIFCSPRGVQSRLVPGHPNALAPGKRPCSTPAPARALGPAAADVTGDATFDRRVWAFGCPGGDVIVQAMVQTFLLMTRTPCSPQEAVEAPRVAGFSYPGGFHPHPVADGVVFAEDRIPAAVRDELAARGHDVRVWPAYEFDAGSVQLALDVVDPGPDGRVLAAAADPRRSAYAGAR